MSLKFRKALESDVPDLVNLLADDELGATREDTGSPINQSYLDAFHAIAGDPEAKGAPGPAFANRALAEDGGYVYECIQGTGHLLQIQKPEECRQAMFSFLAEQGIAE